MSRPALKNILVTSLFLAVLIGLGFCWMYLLLNVVTDLQPNTLLIVSLIAGPACWMSAALYLMSRGENTLVELAMWTVFPVGFVLSLAVLDHRTNLSLFTKLLISIPLSLPTGIIFGGVLGILIFAIETLGLFPESPHEVPLDIDSSRNPDDLHALLKRPNDHDQECQFDGCSQPIVKYTRFCREHHHESS